MPFIKFQVSKGKETALYKKMSSLNIKEKDIVEKFIRSKGKGGQNINKVATCVYLKHLPTDIEIKYQRKRSQNLNRFFARRLLVKKIENKILGKESEEQKQREKIRRQKRKRSKRAKEKMLEDKHKRSQIKQNRKINFTKLLSNNYPF